VVLFFEKKNTQARAAGGVADPHDNSTRLHDILTRRTQLAQLLGYPTYAHVSTARKMAATPQAAEVQK
jgi:oligopeptidase A